MDISRRDFAEGILAMCLWPALVTLVAVGAFLVFSGDGGWAAMLAIGIFVVSVPCAALFAPFGLLLMRKAVLKATPYMGLGALIGASAGAVMLVLADPSSDWPWWPLVCAAFGSASAWCFWFMAVRRLRPNNSSKPTPLRGAA